MEPRGKGRAPGSLGRAAIHHFSQLHFEKLTQTKSSRCARKKKKKKKKKKKSTKTPPKNTKKNTKICFSRLLRAKINSPHQRNNSFQVSFPSSIQRSTRAGDCRPVAWCVRARLVLGGRRGFPSHSRAPGARGSAPTPNVAVVNAIFGVRRRVAILLWE